MSNFRLMVEQPSSAPIRRVRLKETRHTAAQILKREFNRNPLKCWEGPVRNDFKKVQVLGYPTPPDALEVASLVPGVAQIDEAVSKVDLFVIGPDGIVRCLTSGPVDSNDPWDLTWNTPLPDMSDYRDET